MLTIECEAPTLSRSHLHLPRWIWLNHVPEGLDLTPDQRLALRTRMSQLGPVMHRHLGVGKRMARSMVPCNFAHSAVFVLCL